MNDKYESIILLTDNSERQTAFDLYDKFIHLGKKVLILSADNVSISDKNYSSRSFQYYQKFFQTSYFNITQECRDLFYSLAEEKVRGDLTLRELTMYKGVSLWDASVHYIFSEFVLILHDFNMVETIINFESPSGIYIINGENRLGKILELICKKKKIPFFVSNIIKKRPPYLYKLFLKFVIFSKKVKRFFVSFYFLFSNLIKFRTLNKKYKVVFFVSVRRFLDSMLPVILEYNKEERLVIDGFLSGCSERLKELGISYLDFCGYKLYGLCNQHAQRLLKKIYEEITKNESFYKKLLYRETPLGILLTNLFERLIFEVFPNNIQRINIIRKIISSHKPEVIVVDNYSADVVLTAKSLSIGIVAIQNSFVEELYYFGPIIADAVTVDGNYWKEYLLKRQDISSDKVYVTGPVRFDAIVNNRLDIKNADMLFGIDKSKKRVVYATSYADLPMVMADCEKIQQIRAIYSAVKNIKEAYLIVKLHPYEKELDVYKKIAKETGLLNYTVIKNIDMLMMLSNCDLLISFISTVGYEAVLLDKNVISLTGTSNFTSEDIWDFKRYNAAIVLDNFGKLEESIRHALFDQETIEKLKKGRTAYLDQHAYKLDGNASGRVKEVIDRFVLKTEN